MNSNNYSQTYEHKLIDEIKSWTGAQLIGDDCAILPGGQLVTCDTLVEGTHFTRQMKFEDLGWKAIAVNLSDIAAMAGRPRHLIVSLTMPDNLDHLGFERLYRSMIECAKTYRANIVGGDLTSGPLLVISITAIGEVHEDGCLKRSGAKAGDVVLVTGDFGASAAGLWLARNGGDFAQFSHLYERHMRPEPRLCESWALVRQCAGRGALMDASDGLADALVQIAKASGAGMAIDLNLVPIHEQTRSAAEKAKVDVYDWALYGGEDYELVACVDPSAWKKLQELKDNPFLQIGTVQDTRAVTAEGGGHKSFELDLSASFQHFGKL